MKFYGTIKEIIQELLKLELDKKYQVEVKEPKSKRSIEQNKLLWLLIHKIAKETYQDDMEVYCTALERADALSDFVITATDMESNLRKSFRGVQFLRMQEVNGKDCYVYKVYLGSSKMTIKEMNELLEIVFQMCAELQIPTMEDLYD